MSSGRGWVPFLAVVPDPSCAPASGQIPSRTELGQPSLPTLLALRTASCLP